MRFDELYSVLRTIAAVQLRGEWRRGHTLQSVDLVNEAFLRFEHADARDWSSESEFKAAAAHVMRQVLCDHARKRKRLKRGGAAARITLVDSIIDRKPDAEIDPLILDDLLMRLAATDARAARVVEMRFFAGMTMEELAQALGVSKRTVENDWTYARAWLYGKLKSPTSGA